MKGARPRTYDADLLVVGAGSAGLVAAYIGAALKARVVLVESGTMGGDCLNTGCVPSKALIAAARRAHHARNSSRFGIRATNVTVDFAQVMRHVHGAIATIAPHDSVERYARLGVRCLLGEARFLDPWTVSVDGRPVRSRNIVIAAGAEPAVPPVPGLADIPYLTSDNLWQLNSLPAHLAVLGGGPIGCELGQAFARLGASVSLFEMQERLLGGEDAALGELLADRFCREGVSLHTNTRIESVSNGRASFSREGERGEMAFDALLVATGRRPRLAGYGLESLGVEIREGRIGVNPFMQTNHAHIYACGDVTGPYQFTHAAAHQAWHAAVNALFRPFKRFAIDYANLPWAVYTEPQIGRVGLDHDGAERQGVRVERTRFEFSELDRAVAEGETEGFVEILTARGSDRIVGATVAGEGAGELVTTLALAMQRRIGMNKLLAAIVPYPAWSEAAKRAAGLWKQAHAPRWVYPWLERYHRIRRGKKRH